MWQKFTPFLDMVNDIIYIINIQGVLSFYHTKNHLSASKNGLRADKLINHAALTHMKNGVHITTRTIDKLCVTLKCQSGDLKKAMADMLEHGLSADEIFEIMMNSLTDTLCDERFREQVIRNSDGKLSEGCTDEELRAYVAADIKEHF